VHYGRRTRGEVVVEEVVGAMEKKLEAG